MEYVIKNREPADALRYFEEISAIPRGSRNEKAAAEYIKKFAEDRGLWVQMDDMYNLIIKKPGSKGCEDLPAVLLQGHLDIVPEKDPGVEHDFAKDPLKLQVDGKILRAVGTTLGADDGFAIAYMMALLDRDDYVHPPLECVMTTQEEIGLIGALHLDGSCLTARKMIGMDAGGGNQFLVSSAGGNFVDCKMNFTRVPATGEAVAINVGGLIGGHSGGAADSERASAIKLMARALYRLSKECDIQLAEISGGTKVNAIPREASCVAMIQSGSVDTAKKIIADLEKELKAELAAPDPDVFVTIEAASAETMFDKATSDKLMHSLHLMPNGRQVMSKAIPGLVNASLNIGFIAVDEAAGTITIPVSIRSAEDSLTNAIADQIVDLCTVLGIETRIYGYYPAFSYIPNSPLRDKAMALYEEMTGEKAEIRAVHGGVECGVFYNMLPGIDIVGCGPIKGDAHIPTEWMDLDSFEFCFNYLLRLLEELTK